MLKVVIADDEERVCRLIQMLVDWDALGMEVAGTASNGLEALGLVESLKPDILITDIRMPGCDGLELIERARAASPSLEIALISGYAQFEYAQTAIRHDVGGYILKPIKKEVLTETLEKLGAKCRERAATASEAKRMIMDSQKSGEILRDRLLEDLLQGRLDGPSRALLKNDYGFDAPGGCLRAFILKADCPPEAFRSHLAGVITQTSGEIVASALSALCSAVFFKFRLSAGYGIINYGEEDGGKVRRALRECLNSLEARLFGTVELTLAVGSEAKRPELLPKSFREAQAALTERLTEGTGRMYECAAASDDRRAGAAAGVSQPVKAAAGRLLEKYSRAVARAAGSLGVEEADAAAVELYEGISKLEGANGQVLWETALAAGNVIALALNKDGGSGRAAGFAENCALCGSAGKLYEYLRDFQRQSVEAAREALESEAARPIRAAKEFAAKHYGEPITLDDVCASIGFSVNYFSTLFKKETGEGFSQYLTRVRIDQARELLRDTRLPVADICARVGYNDVKHFTGTFKKLTDLSPGQFRKLYG